MGASTAIGMVSTSLLKDMSDRTAFKVVDAHVAHLAGDAVGGVVYAAAGDPEHDIAPGTPWAAVPMNWTCPECGARKDDFEMVPV